MRRAVVVGGIVQRARRIGMRVRRDADAEAIDELAAEPAGHERDRGTAEREEPRPRRRLRDLPRAQPQAEREEDEDDDVAAAVPAADLLGTRARRDRDP